MYWSVPFYWDTSSHFIWACISNACKNVLNVHFYSLFTSKHTPLYESRVLTVLAWPAILWTSPGIHLHRSCKQLVPLCYPVTGYFIAVQSIISRDGKRTVSVCHGELPRSVFWLSCKCKCPETWGSHGGEHERALPAVGLGLSGFFNTETATWQWNLRKHFLKLIIFRG